MATTGKLSARFVATAGVGTYQDGGGLRLVVKPNGRRWVFRFMLDGQRRDMGLGSFDTVSLAQARDEARQARQQARQGIDPVAARQAARQAEAEAKLATENTFASCAERYISSHARAWSNPKHRQQWTNTLATYVNPVCGGKPVGDVNLDDVLAVLQPIWATKPETAARVRGRMEKILDWARVRGLRSGDNPARWRGNLETLLPPRSKVAPVVHHRALPWGEVPAFLVDLRQRPGVAARALEFAVLTAARSGEVRGARWSEVSFDDATWTVPAARMKARREHRVPLSKPALELLETMREQSDSEYVFPSLKGRPLSDMALTMALRRMKVDTTAHGFRSAFRDWAAEATRHQGAVAEMALAHTVADKVEAAYRRGDLFEKRRELMADWARFVDSEVATVVPIRVPQRVPQ